MKMRIEFLTGALGIAAFAVLAAGCNGTEPTMAAEGTAGASSVPTYAEVSEAVTLDEADAAVVKSALAEWKEATTKGEPTAPFGRRRAPSRFVASVAPSLDNAQLSQLVDLLVARREARREEMRAHHKKPTPEQMAKFRARHDRGDKAQRIERRLEKIGQHVDAHVAWLDAVIDLNDAQTAQVKAALTTRSNERKTAFEAMKGESITREQLRERTRATHDALEASLENILTDEQWERLQIVRPLLPHERRRT